MGERTDDASELEADWQRWQDARWRLVSGEHGIAALAATVWLSPDAVRVDGIDGTWRADGDAVVGSGLGASGWTDADGDPVGDTVTLRTGETVQAGTVLLRAFAREGVPALRRIDPAAPRRVSLTSIAAYRPDPAWVVPARWTPRDEPLEVEAVDGHRTVQGDAGTLEMTLGGRSHTLLATRTDTELAVVFRDATSDVDSYAFRFLRPPLPDADGATTLDFNRAFLPPYAFSDQYVCPLPSPANRLDIAVTAGERWPVHSGEDHGRAAGILGAHG